MQANYMLVLMQVGGLSGMSLGFPVDMMGLGSACRRWTRSHSAPCQVVQ
jgi:hypothetical protein